MRTRRFSVLAAALLAISSSGYAQELRPGIPSVTYYVSIPLDGVTHMDKEPVIGFAFQGNRSYQVVRFDSRVMNLLEEVGGFEAKWLIVGAVAAGGAVMMARKDKSVAQQEQQQQAQQQQQQQQQQQAQQSGNPCVCWR